MTILRHMTERSVVYATFWIALILISATGSFTRPVVAAASGFATNAASSSTAPGLMYINPGNVSAKPVGTIFSLTVQVSDMAYFTGWDVVVQTNSSVITPLNLTFAGDLFETNTTTPANYQPTEVANCINGLCKTGNPLHGYDGPGAAHSAAAALGQPPMIQSPINGTLFTITYNVTSFGFSYVDIVWHSLSDNKGNPIPSTVAYGIYGTPKPDFRVSANPARLNVVQGSSNSTAVILSSIQGFGGSLRLTASSGFQPVFGNSTLSLAARGTNITKLTFTTPGSQGGGIYVVTVTASNATVSHSVTLSITVITIPDFELVITPSILKIHAGDSAWTTIQLISLNGFSGNVSLSVQAPSQINATLVSTKLAVQLGGSAATNITISTPADGLPFEYDVYVNGSSNQLSHQQELIIKPPKPSLVIPSLGNISVKQGHITSSTVRAYSGDYFWGFVYASALMSGGAVSFDHSDVYMNLPDNSVASYVPSVTFTFSLFVGANTIPGNYIALVTIYSVADHGQAAVTYQVAQPVTVESYVAPVSILGLSPPIYFGILGALVIPLGLLTIQTYRRARSEKEDSDWRK